MTINTKVTLCKNIVLMCGWLEIKIGKVSDYLTAANWLTTKGKNLLTSLDGPGSFK